MSTVDWETDTKQIKVDGFRIARTEVTQKLYESVMGTNPSYFSGDDYLPVESVTWEEAAQFCNCLSEMNALSPCYDEETWQCDFSKNGFRMPTNVEWNCAARAGSKGAYPTYTYDRLESFEWLQPWCETKTYPVGSKFPNSFGLYDIVGNVFEFGTPSNQCHGELHYMGHQCLAGASYRKMMYCQLCLFHFIWM